MLIYITGNTRETGSVNWISLQLHTQQTILRQESGEAILQGVSVSGQLPQTRQRAHHADDAESTHHAREVGNGLSSFTHSATKEQQLSTAEAILICASKWRN